MTSKQKNDKNASLRSFLTAIGVIFGLMVLTYILTFVVSGGAFDRDETGELIKGSYHYVQGGIPFWKWILSPLLVLGAEGSGTLISVIAFLLVIGGIFSILGEHGLMKYMLDKITYLYGGKRYKLMAIVMFFFMAMGAMIGSFEECVPMVPIVCALTISLGWDSLTGMGISLLAASCGFASGVFNPFTVGVAQELAGIPMFSGVWLRAVSFVLIYALLLFFVRHHAKRIEQPISDEASVNFVRNPILDKGLNWFAGVVGAGIAVVLLSSVLTFLQDYTMIIVAVMFLIGGIVSSFVSGMKSGEMAKSFGRGVLEMLPAVIMILMASSIKYTLESANVLDTLLNGAVGMAATMPKWIVILFIYFIVLIMEFFVSSGSAKAFMLIPLIVPLAQQFGISPQLCIVAFAFGDGFSNVLYPTNAGLLIALGLADISYGKWFKWSIKFQLCNFVLTSLLLLFGLAVGYGF